MATVQTLIRLDRGYVAVSGPEAGDFLERMVSNEVVSLEPGEVRKALLLTPKSRIVAPLRVVREGPDSFLLITQASLADAVASALLRARLSDETWTSAWAAGRALPREQVLAEALDDGDLDR